jgi:hypothetical protein
MEADSDREFLKILLGDLCVPPRLCVESGATGGTGGACFMPIGADTGSDAAQ